MFVTLILLFQCYPAVKSTNVGVSEILTNAKNAPMIAGVQCTSRSLRISSIADSVWTGPNVTIDDDVLGNEEVPVTIQSTFPPYCPEGYFCDLSGTKNKNDTSIDYGLGLCKACGGSSYNCPSIVATTDDAAYPEFLPYSLEECQEQCGAEKNTCSSTIACPLGLFCNFEDGEASGYCEQCPPHIVVCASGNYTSKGLTTCQSTCAVQCMPSATLGITKTGKLTDTMNIYPVYVEDVNAIVGSPQLSVTGPISDCGLGLEPCEGVEGSICFIERGKASFLNKTRNCYAGGGIAAVIYNLEAVCENINATYFGADTYIPSVSLTHFDGKQILNEAKAMPPETTLLVTVDVGGHNVNPEDCVVGCTKENECEGTDTCNFHSGDFGQCTETEYKTQCNDMESFGVDHLQCSAEKDFCDFKFGKRGECVECPKNFEACFFLNLNSKGAEECSNVCTDGNSDKIKDRKCKFCSRGSYTLGELSDGFSTVKGDNLETCEFCASTSGSKCLTGVDRWDMDYPERTIPMFGNDVKCWLVAEFYRSMNIGADTVACDSARGWNYICGCSDTPGYGGANTEAKMVKLVWFPRVGAFLSILGSSLMIINVLRDEKKRNKVIGELIIFLCGFDIVGSIAYSLASYPTPKEDYIYGAVGNTASCTAQGFFIQIGTISLYINVSIAFYYLLIIKFSWREHTLKRSWIYYMLFATPILVGAIFAFAGIPFYQNVILWCNNSGIYWPEIPVVIAIGIATIIMMNLCWFVFKSERASRRFRQHTVAERDSISKAFFLQSLVYLGAFYLTWPPYLALQIMIANGSAFSNYPLMLCAGTAVTLQGFWNYVFHIGLEHTRSFGKNLRSAWESIRSRAGSLSIRQSRRNGETKFGEGRKSNDPEV